MVEELGGGIVSGSSTGELWEDLPYRLSFLLDISNVFLQVGLEGSGS